QVFSNDLGQDLGNRTSGLTTAGGVATADLRGLGPNRTLVLLDGRRLGQGSPYTAIASPAPDLDQVPIFLVDRIEVLTGGASSVYGSDAIAGVVNFILKKNFQGLQFDTQFGENWHKQRSSFVTDAAIQAGLTPLSGNVQDGRNRTFSVIAGTNFGKNVVPYGATTTPPPIFNSQRYIYLARQDDRYQGGLMAHNSLNDYATPYFEFMFMNDKSHQAIAPTAAFTTGNPNTGNPYFVNCGNPFLSAQQLGILGCTAAQISAPNQADPANQVAIQLGRRNIEGGARTSDYEHTNYRAVIGVKGDLTKAWHYDAWGQYYYTTFFNSNDQYFNYANIDNALVVTGTRANPQCVVGAPCVPWNIFQDGGVTPAALTYLYSNGTGAGSTT